MHIVIHCHFSSIIEVSNYPFSLFLFVPVELTDCLSFGCTDDNGECKCLYSNSCPLQRFPYYTLEECEIALKRKNRHSKYISNFMIDIFIF